MERPALQELLEDVKARKIDVVVVYKVDRLTRSLADFAKLVELTGPKATAITRMPCDSSSFASASADGDGSARAITVANAPFTTRKLSPLEPVTVASDALGRIKGRERDELEFGGSAFRAGGRADSEVHGILSAFGACECGGREHIGFGERIHWQCRPDSEFISRQRAGLVCAQDVHCAGFVHGRKPRRGRIWRREPQVGTFR